MHCKQNCPHRVDMDRVMTQEELHSPAGVMMAWDYKYCTLFKCALPIYEHAIPQTTQAVNHCLHAIQALCNGQ